MFQTLHVMFEEHYRELSTAIDVIAEQIRSLNIATPGTYAEFIPLCSIKDVSGVPNGWEDDPHSRRRTRNRRAHRALDLPARGKSRR